MSTEDLRSYVKRRRKELGITQVELARRSGVGLHLVRDIEQGKTGLQTGKVNQVLFLFGAKLAPVPMTEEERVR